MGTTHLCGFASIELAGLDCHPLSKVTEQLAVVLRFREGFDRLAQRQELVIVQPLRRVQGQPGQCT